MLGFEIYSEYMYLELSSLWRVSRNGGVLFGLSAPRVGRPSSRVERSTLNRGLGLEKTAITQNSYWPSTPQLHSLTLKC